MSNRLPLLEIEDARLLFPNFSGKEKTYNRKGDRNFCVAIEDEKMAQKLIADGWNVRVLQPRDEDELPLHYLQVAVRFDNFPPNIFLVNKRGKPIRLDEESVDALDNADILSADLLINPSHWETKDGKSGIKAYLRTMYVVIQEDRFAAKYASDEYPQE